MKFIILRIRKLNWPSLLRSNLIANKSYLLTLFAPLCDSHKETFENETKRLFEY